MHDCTKCFKRINGKTFEAFGVLYCAKCAPKKSYQLVKLTRDLKTMTAEHVAGDIYRMTGSHASLIKLTRLSDKAKLMTLPEYLSAL